MIKGIDYPEWYSQESLDTVTRGYVLENETPKQMYQRVAKALSNYLPPHINANHYEKVWFNYMWKGWLSPASPVLSNVGTNRGLGISCYLLRVDDTTLNIFDKVTEMSILTKFGGGIGVDFGKIRGRGEPISKGGFTEGIVPFLKVYDSAILATSQAGVRRGAMAAYLPIRHKDTEEFLHIREPKGDINRQCLNLNHAISVDDVFMEKLELGDSYYRELWAEILKLRMETGQPYIMYYDNVNRANPECYKQQGFKVNQSNLCVAPETQILTDQGYIPIGELEDTEVNVWNGLSFSKTIVRKTGVQQKLLKVTTDCGHVIECTPYHKWYIEDKTAEGLRVRPSTYKQVSTLDLLVGDRLIKFNLPVIEGSQVLNKAYTNGFFSGDGCYFNNKSIIYLYGEKKKLEPHLDLDGPRSENETRITFSNVKGLESKFFVPNSSYTIESRIKWLSGYLDADGVVCRNGENESLQVASIEFEFLREVQLMLQTLGVESKIKTLKEEGQSLLPTNNGTDSYKLYNTKMVYRLLISSNGLFQLATLGLKTHRLAWTYRKPQRECAQFIKIASIEDVNRTDDTFCFTESIRGMGMFNGVLTGQCSEIVLYTDPLHTAVCCLSSLNISKWDEWKTQPDFIFDSVLFLDCLMEDFIQKGGKIKGFENAVRFAKKSRPLALGVLGWHTYLQSQNIPFISFGAKGLINKIGTHISEQVQKATKHLGSEFGVPEWCVDTRNSHCTAIAPTTTNSLIQGGVSQGIEPIVSNYFVQKSAKGTFIRKNPQFQNLIETKYPQHNTQEMWTTVRDAKGSIQHLQFLTDAEKEVFLTAYEINQLELVKSVGVWQKYIDQAISTNLFFPADVPSKWVNQVHLEAWKQKLKTLYYIRTESIASRTMKSDTFSDCVYCEG